MTEHRFFAGEGVLATLAPNAAVALPADAAHRIARVLRLRPGERIAIFGEGREFACELIDVGRSVRVRVLEELPAAATQHRLLLYPALIRPNRFEWLIEKVTEVGVAAIIPILSERCAVRAAEIGATRIERWRRIAVEAAEQSGRRTVPAIATPIPYADALAQAAGRPVLAWEGLRGERTMSVPEGGSELRVLGDTSFEGRGGIPSPEGEGEGEGAPKLPADPRLRASRPSAGTKLPLPLGPQGSPQATEGRGEGTPALPGHPAPHQIPSNEVLALFIGPEGGWSDAEVEMARADGAALLGLGVNVLRAETAAIVASALLLNGSAEVPG